MQPEGSRRRRNGGNGLILPLQSLKDRADLVLYFFNIRSEVEVEDQPREARLRRMTFPHARGAIAGNFSDNSIDEIVWNINGEPVPRHKKFGNW